MKLLIMPPAPPIRQKKVDHKAIVANVLKMRPEITAKRKDVVKIHSIQKAEFTHEIEKLDQFRSKLNQNIRDENEKQKAKFKEMKEKYDKEGVEVVESVQDLVAPKKKEKKLYSTLENMRDVNDINTQPAPG